MIETENVPEPSVTVQPNNEPDNWKYEKSVEIDFEEIEEDCIYRYRINNGSWVSITGAVITLNIIENNTLVDVQVLNAENHIIQEKSIEVLGVDHTLPIISAKENQFAVAPESNHPVLEFFNHLENFGESGGNYACSIVGNSLAGETINIQDATNTSVLPLGINYTLSCIESLGNGRSKTASTKIMTAEWIKKTCLSRTGSAPYSCNCVGSGGETLTANACGVKGQCDHYYCWWVEYWLTPETFALNNPEYIGCWTSHSIAGNHKPSHCEHYVQYGGSAPYYWSTCNCSTCGGYSCGSEEESYETECTETSKYDNVGDVKCIKITN